ncbi:MAG: hypothetical protein C0501_30765 [Isosphaera sp.]|nr:hypothetical protein [Isosphaera sp.]
MPRPRKACPRYLEHKQSGRARAVWTDPAGTYHDVLLPGPFGSDESRRAFGKLLLEHQVSPAGTRVADRSGLTVAEVLLAYLEHANGHYRGPDGRPTSELVTVKLVVKAIREVYADLPAGEFTALKLKAVRQGWVAASLSRGEVNRRTRIAKRVFKWAAGEELIPAETFTGLALVGGLQKGRTTARETEAVGPVADAVVDATLPFLSRHARGLVELQRLTGMRPGEACRVRRADLDTTGAVWVYTVREHKTAHRGKVRTVAIGPRGQELLKGFFTDDPDAYLFSPAAAVGEQRAERSAGRKTPKYPSHMRRNAGKRAKRPRRTAGSHYTPSSLGHAIDRACDRAFPPPAPLAQQEGETGAAWEARLTAGQKVELKAWRDAHRWHPNQLRHSFATRVRKAHGLEAAQVLLGHAKADVTQVYAEKNDALAAAVAAEVG